MMQFLLMATIGLARFLIGAGQFIFGGENRAMITEEIGLPVGASEAEMFEGGVFEHLDISAVVIAALMVTALAIFFNKTRIGRALRAVADDHQAALSVGISLNQIWAIVWFAAGIVALVTGIMWGARSDVSFALRDHRLESLSGAHHRRFYLDSRCHHRGIIVGVLEKIFEIFWGPLFGESKRGSLTYPSNILALQASGAVR